MSYAALVKMSDLPVEIFDGYNTIGGTKILVENEGRGLLLDFGLNFNDFGHYYEEYLKPRGCFGLNDFWNLELVPRYRDLYRDDLCECTLLGSRELPVSSIDGVFLSHAHADHSGLIGCLKNEIPILCSSPTLAILRATQDSGKTEYYNQVCYNYEYKTVQNRDHTIVKDGGYSKYPHHGRNSIVLTNDLTPELFTLWRRMARPDEKGRKMVSGNIQNQSDVDLNWDITAFPVDHSILGACAIKINTDRGGIYYTGDLRKNGMQRENTDIFVREASASDPWILIIEGTQVTRDALCETTEEECREYSLDLIAENDGKFVIADFSPRNIERLKTFHDIAIEVDRRLIITAKDAYLLDCLQTTENDAPLPSDNILIFDAPKASDFAWEKWIYEKYGDFRTTAQEISADPSGYILSFSFFDIKHIIDIHPENGLYLYSSSEPFDEEQQFDTRRLYNWLDRFNFEIRGLTFENGEWHIEPGYHCSGHVTRQELEEIIREITPEILIPVHTKDREWFRRFGDITEVII